MRPPLFRVELTGCLLGLTFGIGHANAVTLLHVHQIVNIHGNRNLD